MGIEIEDNIPIPEKKSGTPAKYPFREMGVGQSFWVNGEQATISSYAGYYAKQCSSRFTTRLEIKDGVKGTRVWRVE